MIANWERKTKKPFSRALRSRVVKAVQLADIPTSSSWLSKFRLGEWIVELLCLIPLQLAITRSNRFVPLKDGVYSTEMQQELLGADFGTIVHTLSLGWYENLLGRYYRGRPVKVVSSMGQQSVGKSYMM